MWGLESHISGWRTASWLESTQVVGANANGVQGFFQGGGDGFGIPPRGQELRVGSLLCLVGPHLRRQTVGLLGVEKMQVPLARDAVVGDTGPGHASKKN